MVLRGAMTDRRWFDAWPVPLAKRPGNGYLEGTGGGMDAITYDAYLEREEFITADEYLRRYERGEIDPKRTRIVPATLGKGDFGGFMVELETPRYRVAFPEMRAGDPYGW